MPSPADRPDPPRTALRAGAILGASVTFAVVGLAALGHALFGWANPAYGLFEWVSRILPGSVVTYGIDQVVRLVRALGVGSTASAAKVVEQVLAILLAIGGGAVAGAAIAAVSRARRPHVGREAGVGREDVGAREGPRRRGVLAGLAGAAAGIGALGFGLSRWLTGRREPAAASGALEVGGTSGPAASPPEATLAARWAPVPGTRPELTSNEDFYRVDINLTPPSVDEASWRLEISGLVRQPQALSLDELRARPAVSQIITLECISNPVGGDLIGTSRWTGMRVADLLRDVGVGAGARALAFEAADGFHESATIEEVSDPRALLVYAMNGEPLPVEHGFPLRLYIPDRHGMKLPKWIRRIDLVDQARPGYWVERGWSATAIPHTTSVIDTIRATGAGDQRRLSVGGIAYAGARGISKVEVQIDDGPWRPAQLRTPPLGPLTWVQWRLDGTYTPGRHTVRVRAYDGTGAPQEVAVQPPHPSGATGIDQKAARV